MRRLLRLTSGDLLRLGWRPASLPWSLRAQAALFKSSIRAFDFATDTTIKMADFRSDDAALALANEIAIRQRVRSTPSIQVPALLHRGAVDGRPFMLERLERFDRLQPNEADLRRLGSSLLDFYRASGASWQTLDRLSDLQAMFVRVTETLKSGGFDAALTERLSRLQTRIEKSAATGETALAGLCHGDMSLGNMMFDDTRVVLVDWEHARDTIVCADLVKLVDQAPDLRAPLERQIGSWGAAECGTPMRTELQMALGAVIAIDLYLARPQTLKHRANRQKVIAKMAVRLDREMARADV